MVNYASTSFIVLNFLTPKTQMTTLHCKNMLFWSGLQKTIVVCIFYFTVFNIAITQSQTCDVGYLHQCVDIPCNSGVPEADVSVITWAYWNNQTLVWDDIGSYYSSNKEFYPASAWVNKSVDVVSNNGTLYICNITTDEELAYRCSVTRTSASGGGIVRAESVFVHLIRVSASSTTISKPDTAFRCSVISNPVSNITWSTQCISTGQTDCVLNGSEYTCTSDCTYDQSATGNTSLTCATYIDLCDGIYEETSYTGFPPQATALTSNTPNTVSPGAVVQLSCNVTEHGNPSTSYTYTWRSSSQPLNCASQTCTLNIEKESYNDTYWCVAGNIFGTGQEANFTLIVNGDSHDQDGLSGGAIAGITIAVTVVVGGAVGLTFYFVKRSKKQ